MGSGGVELRGVEAGALVTVQSIDGIQFGVGEFETEDVEVLLDTGWGHRLGEEDASALQVPTNDDLSGG